MKLNYTLIIFLFCSGSVIGQNIDSFLRVNESMLELYYEDLNFHKKNDKIKNIDSIVLEKDTIIDSIIIVKQNTITNEYNTYYERFNSVLDKASGEIHFQFNKSWYYGFIFDSSLHSISLNWHKGSNYFKDLLLKDSKYLMLTNGGMYTPNFHAEGLLIIDSLEIFKVDTGTIEGLNFYMKPNGVFYKINDEFYVKETKSFLKETEMDTNEVAFATQSGPMLLINGEIHPRFNYKSRNRNLRSGVGILENGKVIFIISKGRNTNFHEFASIFKYIFFCENALYLDGAISSMYLRKGYTVGNINGGPFGPIISIKNKK